jgi:hypothetical protein
VNEGYIDMMHVQMQYLYLMSDEEIPLAALLQEPGQKCYYTYDLGDSWQHKLELEEIVEDKKGKILLLEGKGGCPPEDSIGLEMQGSYGYAEFLEEYKKNPKKQQHVIREVEQTAVNYSQSWAGIPVKFRPLEFDIAFHRSLMQMMLSGPSVSKEEFGRGFVESMRACACCGSRVKALQRCSRCKQVWYCSKSCQKKDWKNHKLSCKAEK